MVSWNGSLAASNRSWGHSATSRTYPGPLRLLRSRFIITIPSASIQRCKQRPQLTLLAYIKVQTGCSRKRGCHTKSCVMAYNGKARKLNLDWLERLLTAQHTVTQLSVWHRQRTRSIRSHSFTSNASESLLNCSFNISTDCFWKV